MLIGVMQPYFFPYPGYFELIERTDDWVVFDIVQYSRKSWMNRNRILHPSKGWQYISVPVVHKGKDMTIAEAELQDKEAAKTRVLGQLDHYRKHAPYFSQVKKLVSDAFDRTKSNDLVDLNVNTLSVVCEYLGIEFAPRRCSEMSLDLLRIEHAGQWALEICSSLRATSYLNPPGGKHIFDLGEWEARGIELLFTEMQTLRYETPGYQFEPNLSIIDALMWMAPDNVIAELRARPVPRRRNPYLDNTHNLDNGWNRQ